MGRITIDGTQTQFSCKLTLNPKTWDLPILDDFGIQPFNAQARGENNYRCCPGQNRLSGNQSRIVRGITQKNKK